MQGAGLFAVKYSLSPGLLHEKIDVYKDTIAGQEEGHKDSEIIPGIRELISTIVGLLC